MSTLGAYDPGQIIEGIFLKIIKVDVRTDARIVTVMDKLKCVTTLAFFSINTSLADQFKVGTVYKFLNLICREKWAAPNRPVPPGVQLVFDAKTSDIEGFEVQRPESLKGVPILGVNRFIDGHPVLESEEALTIKPGQVKSVPTTAVLIDSITSAHNLVFQPTLGAYESGLLVLNLPAPNVSGKIFVPIYNMGKQVCNVPKSCHLALLMLVSKPRMKFTAETLDMSGFEEADSNGVEFIASDDDDQKRAVKRAPNSTARAEVANKQSKQSTSTQPRQIVISDDEADEQPSTSKERVTIAKKVPRASLKATVDKAKKDFTPI